MFTAKWTEEWRSCKFSLALLRSQRASMSPQDWAQITFRSEMHLTHRPQSIEIFFENGRVGNQLGVILDH